MRKKTTYRAEKPPSRQNLWQSLWYDSEAYTAFLSGSDKHFHAPGTKFRWGVRRGTVVNGKSVYTAGQHLNKQSQK